MSVSVCRWRCAALLRSVSCVLLFFLASYSAMAAPDISGTFSGQLSGSEQCEIGPGGPISVTFTLSFSQSGNSFTASGSGTTSDGGSAELKLKSGTIDADGSMSATLEGTTDENEQLSGSVSGSLSDNDLSLSVNYTLTGNDHCQGTLSGTLSRSGGDIIVDPAETPSSTITNTILNTIQVQAVTSDLSSRVGGILRGGGGSGIRRTSTGLMFESISGQNAGDGLVSGFGLWSSYSYSDFDNDLSSTALDGSRHSVLAGIDFFPWEQALFGLAFGYETSDVDTRFNNGNQQSDGYTIAPYFGVVISDTWSVDGSVGYSRIDIDQFRTDPASGNRIDSSPASDRWFATLNINAFKAYRQWLFGGQIGYLWTRNTQEAFTESNGVARPEVINKLGQWHVSGDVAYSLGRFEPFARLTYERDYSITEITVVGGGPQPSNDRDGFVAALGVRYFSDSGISGNLEWNRRFDRDNFSEDSLMMTLRGEF